MTYDWGPAIGVFETASVLSLMHLAVVSMNAEMTAELKTKLTIAGGLLYAGVVIAAIKAAAERDQALAAQRAAGA